jgi:hypothetical protein
MVDPDLPQDPPQRPDAAMKTINSRCGTPWAKFGIRA